IDTSTEPAELFVQLEIADIHVDNGHPGVIGVNDDGHSRSEKVIFVHSERFFNRFWQFAVDSRVLYAALLSHIAILYNAGTPSTASVPFPQLLLEGCFSVEVFQASCDLVLNRLVCFCNKFLC